MNKSHYNHSPRRGFGLIEVLFATAIFIVVVGSLVSLSRLSLRNATLSAHSTQAVNLAEDGLEAVRQMRDTAWIQSGSTNIGSWLSYPDCQGGITTVVKDKEYAVCYFVNGSGSVTSRQFGLRPIKTPEPAYDAASPEDEYIILTDANGKQDPGAPLYYRRIITFECVPDAEITKVVGSCDGGTASSLNILNEDNFGQVKPITGVESINFIKVRVTVDWQDFDKPWSSNLTTILTNWQGK